MDEYIWIWVIIYMMPVMTALWLLLMWANHEDYKKEHNIKGWSDKDMNVKQLLVATAVSTIVGTSGYLIGTYYGSISMLDTIKSWLRQIAEVGLLVIAAAVVLEIIFGSPVEFVGLSILDNITALTRELGEQGLVGIISIAIIIWLYLRR